MDIGSLVSSFGGLIYTIVAFLVLILIIVGVHEMGHYLIGRWVGIKADVFSLGFGPVLASATDKRGTRWQLAAIPLGGYVKFAGDANAASMGGDSGTPLARHTMLGAPIWARALAVIGGPLFNFIFAIAIFAGVFMFEGLPRTPLTVAELAEMPPGTENGLMVGDEILGVAGVTLPADGQEAIYTMPDETDPTSQWRVRRGSEELTVIAPPPRPALAGSVSPNSAAFDAGVKVGDVMLEVAGQPVHAFAEVPGLVEASAGAPILFKLWRPGQGEIELTITPRAVDYPLAEGGFQRRWLVGIGAGQLFEPQTEMPSILQALNMGQAQVRFLITKSLEGMVSIATGAISTCNLAGPVAIAETTSDAASQGFQFFIWLLAGISAAVGLMNLLPIPVLDGGHLVFHAYEAITRRKPTEGAFRLLTAIGLSLVLGLMFLTFANDLFLC